jgi:MarR family transcriptional regulator, organic hydroperoxide resistance regulator
MERTMSLPAPLPLDDQLCFTIYSASLSIARLYKPILDEFGITYPQHLVIDVLAEGGNLSVGEIAERLSLEPSTITPLLKRLESAGFVSRSRNPLNERQVVVSLLPSGQTLHQQSKCLSETLLISSGLTPPDLIRMNADIQALNAALVKTLSVQKQP